MNRPATGGSRLWWMGGSIVMVIVHSHSGIMGMVNELFCRKAGTSESNTHIQQGEDLSDDRPRLGARPVLQQILFS
ncbi:hypothetical protein FPQ18DRAFT_83871 [Pyronema domesticum]|nr:hypothetical protein FPQ18DRAFT_83871 [Pyronema domesticum]